MSNVVSGPIEREPNSAAVRAEARREAHAACEAIAEEARERIIALKRAQADELARAKVAARGSVKRLSVMGIAVAAFGFATMFTWSLRSLTPTLAEEDGGLLLSDPAFSPEPPVVGTLGRAVPEVGKEQNRTAEPGLPAINNPTPQGNCSEWDPLCFGLKG